MELCLPVAVQPYLKQYLSNLVGVEPFLLTEKNRFGSYLINCLRFKTQAEIEKSPHANKRYQTAELDVLISEYYWTHYGNVFSSKAQLRFDNFLRLEFKDRMMEFVVPKIKRKGDLNMMLLTFREKYSICEDELPLKTMQKIYERSIKEVTNCKSA